MLKTGTIGRSSNNELHELIDSTSTRLAALARDGAPEGTVVFARQQTAGRGRLGRQWVSPPNSGIYVSLLLRPSQSLGELPVITLGIGVAAAKAIFATTGLKVGLKWVNDLVFDGKKLGGILAEMLSGDRQQPALIVGIGINTKFSSEEVPQELKEKMSWLEAAADAPVDTNQLAAELCFQIESIYELMKLRQTDKILDEWRAFSITLGQEIVCTTPVREIKGTAIDVTASGALIVQTATGTEELVGGELSIRTASGSYC